MKHLVVLSGAGMSAESGIRTFRDNGGLWEEYSIYEVATPDAWQQNPELVMRFYNERRLQLAEVSPNKAHLMLKELEKHYTVSIITQNVDNLHERAGSTHIIHLHGELTKVRSTLNSSLIYDVGTRAVQLGEHCELGSQLRPHIVWFGEEVPEMLRAEKEVEKADVLLIIGTSLQVYPAAGLAMHGKASCLKYYIDPHADDLALRNVKAIKDTAVMGLEKILDELIAYSTT